MSRKSFFFIGGVVGKGDGHKRITKTNEGMIFGGTQEEHERHVERCMKANEAIKKNIGRSPEYLQSTVDEIMGEE